MMVIKYWIHSVETENDDGDSGKAILSTSGHGECIVIYGDQVELTARIIKVLEGLNKEAELKI